MKTKNYFKAPLLTATALVLSSSVPLSQLGDYNGLSTDSSSDSVSSLTSTSTSTSYSSLWLADIGDNSPDENGSYAGIYNGNPAVLGATIPRPPAPFVCAIIEPEQNYNMK